MKSVQSLYCLYSHHLKNFKKLTRILASTQIQYRHCPVRTQEEQTKNMLRLSPFIVFPHKIIILFSDLIFPDFPLTFCWNSKIPWLFPDWKNFSHFSRFSSVSGNHRFTLSSSLLPLDKQLPVTCNGTDWSIASCTCDLLLPGNILTHLHGNRVAFLYI